MSKEKWNEMNEQLKLIMKREVSLLRELLSNMHEEELELIKEDTKGWEFLTQERIALFDRLDHLKQARLETREKMIDLLPLSQKNKPLEAFLALNEENYSELELLKSQTSALLERTEFQNQRNVLLQQAKQQLILENSYAGLLKEHPKKKKSAVTTYEE